MQKQKKKQKQKQVESWRAGGLEMHKKCAYEVRSYLIDCALVRTVLSSRYYSQNPGDLCWRFVLEICVGGLPTRATLNN